MKPVFSVGRDTAEHFGEAGPAVTHEHGVQAKFIHEVVSQKEGHFKQKLKSNVEDIRFQDNPSKQHFLFLIVLISRGATSLLLPTDALISISFHFFSFFLIL